MPLRENQYLHANQKEDTGFNQINLNSLFSVLILMVLIAGISYGVYVLLKDLQQVGFAPLPFPPEISTSSPLLWPPTITNTTADISAYEWNDIQPTLPSASERDGPISHIDPETSGIFPGNEIHKPPKSPRPGTGIPDGPNGGMRITLPPDETIIIPVTRHVNVTPKAEVVLYTIDRTWIRVHDNDTVIFEGILQPGDKYHIPEHVTAPLLRTGNAGTIFVLINDVFYGPIGSSRVVISNMSLLVKDIIKQVPVIERNQQKKLDLYLHKNE